MCRAPGRINLLGEHIDYVDLSVLPMSLTQSVYGVFARRNDNQICVDNVDTTYPRRQFTNGVTIPSSEPGCWENYAKAAIAGLNEALSLDSDIGMDLLVYGDIPAAAGLSSSSALVVATALAYLAVANRSLDGDVSRLRLAGILAHAERYVGTQGGGMDQAAILLGERGCACKVDFGPLRTEAVPVFPEHVFLVCHSLVVANKTGSARQRYNEGPITSRLIRAMVEQQARRAFGEDVMLPSLGALWFGPLCLLDREVEELFGETFPHERTTLETAAQFLNIPVATIRERWIGDLPEPDGGFPLRARARHYLTEYQRVEAGRDALVAGNAVLFGKLMDASHESCASDYRVSCQELDRLAALGRVAGGLGSRLTGAGFGGCTIHLVPVTAVDDFLAHVDREYYKKDQPKTRCLSCDDARPFVATPDAAAGYL